MAIVPLTRDEVQSTGALPPVCIRCGMDSNQTVPHTFHCTPVWAAVLAIAFGWMGLILVPFATRRMRAEVPVCSDHVMHLRRRSHLLVIGLALAIGLFAALLVLAWRGVLPMNQDGDWVMLVLFGSMISIVIGFLPLAVAQAMGVRALEIRRKSLVLAGVAPRFRDAVFLKRELNAVGLDPVDY
jgi:hypothetical protein